MLQQISRYADLARQHKGEHNYVEMLGERVELASKTAQALFDRVTSQILAGSTARAAPVQKTAHPQFTVVPPPRKRADRSQRRRRRAPTPMPRRGHQRCRAAAALAPAAAKPAAPAPIPAGDSVLNPNGNRELILLVDDETEICRAGVRDAGRGRLQGDPGEGRIRSAKDLPADRRRTSGSSCSISSCRSWKAMPSSTSCGRSIPR